MMNLTWLFLKDDIEVLVGRGDAQTLVDVPPTKVQVCAPLMGADLAWPLQGDFTF